MKMKMDNATIRANYAAADGPELRRERNDSLPTWQVAVVCAVIVIIVILVV